MRSNQFVILLPTSSGRITINELPILLITISEPNTMQKGKISKITEAVIGKCFSSLKILFNHFKG